jgi:hypothetical protein
MVKFATATLGFGRMGPNRELKFALEKYWKKSITEAELMETVKMVEDLAWSMQMDAGIDRISVGDYCLYDNVASWSEFLGIIPNRFASMDRGIDRMFAMCRGVKDAEALSKYRECTRTCTNPRSVFVSSINLPPITWEHTFCPISIHLPLLPVVDRFSSGTENELSRYEEVDYSQLPLHGT